jgi:hypothetical protein
LNCALSLWQSRPHLNEFCNVLLIIWVSFYRMSRIDLEKHVCSTQVEVIMRSMIFLFAALFCKMTLAEVTSSSVGFSSEQQKSENSKNPLQVQYVDKEGNEWSQILPKRLTNGCRTWQGQNDGRIECDSQRIDQTSLAYAACSQEGWRLPKREDWDRLVQEFDFIKHSHGFSLSKKGIIDFKKKFNAKNNDTYASATMSGKNYEHKAFAFSTEWDGEYIKKLIDNNLLAGTKEQFSAQNRDQLQSVICVRANTPAS